MLGSPRWRHRASRLVGPARTAVLTAVAVLAIALPPAARAASIPASVYSNITAFDTCDGTPDTISRSLETLAQSGLAALGYSASAYATTAFTRSRVLSRAPADQAIYVHSHGDQYYDPYPTQVEGFREDGGDCSQAIVHATDLKTVRAPAVHLVIMSTCHLAEAARTTGEPTMPAAYGIARVKYTDPGAPDAGPRFYLGYDGLAYTADMLHFEQRFWSYVGSGHLLGDAFTLARAAGGLTSGTVPDWFGTYAYSGAPGDLIPCVRCR